MDEFFEVLTLIQTKKITPIPIVLVGTKFWGGLMDWIKATLLDEYGNISAKDLDLFHVVDEVEEVIRIINEFYPEDDSGDGKLVPNYDI